MQTYTVWRIRESGLGALMDLEAAGTAALYFEGVIRVGQNKVESRDFMSESVTREPQAAALDTVLQ